MEDGCNVRKSPNFIEVLHEDMLHLSNCEDKLSLMKGTKTRIEINVSKESQHERA
jgi:hypothetical protein